LHRGADGRVDVVADAETLGQVAAERMASAIAAAVAARGRCDLALAGGATPKRAYEALAAAPLPWRSVHVWFGDERCVPPDDEASNYRLARIALLDRVTIPPANVHRMRGEETDRDAAALAYERELPAALDLLLLGMGQDGHTASLFPGSDALREERRRVVAVVGQKPPPHRLTITPPVVRAARELLVLAAGADKAAAARRALQEEVDPIDCPARLLRDGAWLLDRPAAAEIETTLRASMRGSRGGIA